MKTKIPLLLLAGLVLMASYASAATRTFTGEVDNTWENSLNWANDVPPTSADRTRFSADATLSTSVTVAQFWADTGGNVTIANGGYLTTGTGNPSMDFRNGSSLTIEDGGTVESLRRLRWLDFPVGSGAQTLAVNAGGTLLATLGEFSGGTLQIAGDATFSDTLRTGGTSFAPSISVLDLQPGGTLNVTGLMQWDGASAISVGAGSTLNFGGSGTHVFTDGVVTAAGGVVKASGSGTQTLGDVISGDGSFEQSGAGTTTLTGANTYTGGTTLNDGTITVANASALGTGTLTLNGGTLDIGVVLANDIIASGTTTMVNQVQGNFALTGSITGAGTLNFGGSDSASGFYNISGTDLSSFTGTISHNNVNGTHQLIMGQNGTVNAAQASLETTGSTTAGNYIRLFSNTTFGELSGTGGRIIGRNTLTINQSNDTTYAGRMSSIQAGLSFTKAGSGSLTLTGANDYTGTTTINNGTLIIDGNQSLATGAMTINVSGTLGGSGTIGASLLTVNGVIAPGNSPGTLATGSQLWNDGGSYLWEINASNDAGGTIGTDPGWDWLDITGTLDLSLLSTGGFTIDIDSLTSGNIAGDAVGFDTWTKGNPGDVDYSFTIATASSGITGFDADNFTLDSSGFSNAPSWDWQIIQDGANDLVLQAYAVPEPSSTALLGLGGLALMLRRKRSAA